MKSKTSAKLRAVTTRARQSQNTQGMQLPRRSCVVFPSLALYTSRATAILLPPFRPHKPWSPSERKRWREKAGEKKASSRARTRGQTAPLLCLRRVDTRLLIVARAGGRAPSRVYAPARRSIDRRDVAATAMRLLPGRHRRPRVKPKQRPARQHIMCDSASVQCARKRPSEQFDCTRGSAGNALPDRCAIGALIAFNCFLRMDQVCSKCCRRKRSRRGAQPGMEKSFASVMQILRGALRVEGPGVIYLLCGGWGLTVIDKLDASGISEESNESLTLGDEK